MEAEVLLEALARTLTEMEPEKFGDTVPYVEGTAASTIQQLKADKLVYTLGDL